MKFTIAVCTRNRPQMLSNCINSIKNLVIPSNCQLHLVIVENNESPECKSLINDLMKTTPDLNYSYILEKKLGLPMVRNTAVERAIEMNADWIGFLDDDQVVGSDWLIKFHNTILTGSADVYTGKLNYVLPENVQPENLPVWFKFPFTHYEYPEDFVFDATGTGNTIVKASYFDGQLQEFRFDEKFRFTGGEDYDLFNRITKCGGVIKYVKDAVANEVIARDRISIKWVVAKEYSNGNLTGYGHVSQIGNWRSAKFREKTLYLIREIMKRSFSGTLFFAWGLLIWPFSKRGIRYIVKGIKKVSWVMGLLLGFTKFRFNLYKKTEGS